MSFFTLVLTAFGLAMDAFAVAITSGIVINTLQIKNALKIGFFFGFFQGFMPLVGWVAGIKFSDYIVQFDHWVAFIVLGFIGIKMIYESFKNDEEKYDFNPLNNKVLFFLAIATSIDALAIGVSFAFLKVSILYAATVIGGITFVMSFMGVNIGRKSGELLKRKAEVTGGITLTLIGIKILLEHLNITLATIFNLFN